jgi:hypothetical protein
MFTIFSHVAYRFALKMEATGPSESLITVSQTTLGHTPQDHILQEFKMTTGTNNGGTTFGL